MGVILARVYAQCGRASGGETGFGDRAEAVLTDLIERDPDNLMARITLAELHAGTGKLAELVEEQERNLADARGGPLEPHALLRMARIYAPRGRRAEASMYYGELIEKEPRLAGVAYSELGVGAFLDDDFPQAREYFEKSISEYESVGDELAKHSRQLFGERLWRFTGGVEVGQALLYQAHIWLAGVCAKDGDAEAATQHLQSAAAQLNSPELASERIGLAEHAAQMIQSNFAELAEEPAMRQIAG